MNVEAIRKDFPILERKIKGKKLVYLDNSATTQKPLQVIDTITEFYKEHNANIHRGVHKLSEEATILFEEAHDKVGSLINSKFEETIFTSGTTESLNLLAHALKHKLNAGDEIVLTQMEHHSNIVPWQIIAKETKAKLRFLEINKEGTIDQEQLNKVINKKTKIVSATHMSNVLGIVNDIKAMGKVAHDNNALFIVDGAQSVPQMPIDVKKLDVDFLAFSGHKMLAPTGIGVMYGKEELLESMPPYMSGGDMIKYVTFEDSEWNNLPWKYEAGTPNIAGGIGLGAAVDYLKKIGLENIETHEKKLTKYATDVLGKLGFLDLYGFSGNKRAVFSFNIKNTHAHDVASLLDDDGIAIRGGHHCAMPLMSVLGINGSARASAYIYNTKEEIDLLAESLKKVQKIFS